MPYIRSRSSATLKSLDVYCRGCGAHVLNREAPRVTKLREMSEEAVRCPKCNRAMGSVDYSRVKIIIHPEDGFFGVKPRTNRLLQ